MATNHTERFKLNQWLATDAVLRSDFNADNQRIESALKDIPRFVAGSYIGSGTFGPDNPKRLLFTFRPLLLIVVADAGYISDPGAVFIFGQQESTGLAHYESSSYAMQLHVTWEDGAVSWYTDRQSADPQLNKEGVIYRFFALGLYS